MVELTAELHLARAHKMSARAWQQHIASSEHPLPSLDRIYRFFESWDEVRRYVGMPMRSKGQTWFTDEQLVEAALYVADQLGTNVLSESQYRTYQERKAPHLPSASVVRKRLGEWRWSQAMLAVGLRAPEHTKKQAPDHGWIIRSLQMAAAECDPMETLNQITYNEYVNDHPGDGHPEVMSIMDAYETWEAALNAANIELDDDLHKSGWTMQETWWALQMVQKFTQQAVTRDSYERTRARAKRFMPSWATVLDVLGLEEMPDGSVRPLATSRLVAGKRQLS